MGVLASVNCYTTRVNLSVALVVMVNNTWIEHQIEGSNHDVHHISPCVPENASVTDVEVRVSVSDLLLVISKLFRSGTDLIPPLVLFFFFLLG